MVLASVMMGPSTCSAGATASCVKRRATACVADAWSWCMCAILLAVVLAQLETTFSASPDVRASAVMSIALAVVTASAVIVRAFFVV